MIKNFTFFLCLAITLASCNSNNSNSNASETQEAKPSTQQQIYLPSIPLEELQNLWNNCNQVDYLYYELPMSTSLDDQSSIQTQLRYISDTPVSQQVKDNCKAMARIFYKKDGEDLIESDLYFSDACSFYVFYKDGKAVYSNLMTDVGKQYFGNMLQQILGKRNQ